MVTKQVIMCKLVRFLPVIMASLTKNASKDEIWNFLERKSQKLILGLFFNNTVSEGLTEKSGGKEFFD